VFLNISEAANLAIHALAYLARDGVDRPVAAATIAGSLEVSEAHLVKVLQRVKKVGLVDSVRGPRGGFTLARPLADISLLDIYEAIDGPLSRETCLLGARACRLDDCVFGTLLQDVGRQVGDHFANTTLADLLPDD
jgi:Rrf2 family nitric oxide-sensitive transcriptional repressor